MLSKPPTSVQGLHPSDLLLSVVEALLPKPPVERLDDGSRVPGLGEVELHALQFSTN
jgi:hypothetical protein